MNPAMLLVVFLGAHPELIVWLIGLYVAVAAAWGVALAAIDIGRGTWKGWQSC